MIEIKDKYNCCGCAACIQRCPKQCISLEEDNEGFLYPNVNKLLCVDCHLCEKVCPILNKKEDKKPIIALAAINTDEGIRLKSSFGGIFTLLAEKIIANEGMVFGAAFDKNWEVHHEEGITIEDLCKFRGSKYVQSKIENSYKKTEYLLKEGKKVLFSGTPCQIAGLKCFLQKEYLNLTTVDFICHGVPSPGIWRWYIKNQIFGTTNTSSKLKDINFRDKTYGWRDFQLTFQFKSSTPISSTNNANGYMIAFLNNICLRPSCYQCPAKSGRSHSDITIADFWGVNNFNIDLDDNKGTSLVLINTNKGLELVKNINMNSKEININKALESNKSWHESAKVHELRNLFYKQYKKHESDFTSFTQDLIHTKSITKRVIRKIFRTLGYNQLPI